MKAIIVALSLSVAADASACSCAASATFLESAQRSSIVIEGVVRHYVNAIESRRPLAMDVEVRQVFKGSYRGKKIRIIGDFGMQCLPYVSNFPIGSAWIFAVEGPTMIRTLGDENFSFPMCADAWLAVVNGYASGPLDGRSGWREIGLDALPRLLADPKPDVGTRAPFASLPASGERGVTPPAIAGETTVHPPPGCKTNQDPLAVDLVIGETGKVLWWKPQRRIELCGGPAVYNLILNSWHITPASHDGKPIAVRHTVMITFGR